ncbi:MAG: epimerase [Planctomyces sp.]|nr:epimerase [Planctomyces sp.]
MSEPINETGANKETIIITGVSGLIGSHVTQHLSDSYNLVGLDITPPSQQDTRTFFIETDLTEANSIQKSLSQIKGEFGNRIASVIHLAAYYDFTGKSSPLYDKLTVEGTRKLLQALKTEGLEVEQFIFSSSILVMKPTDEDEKLDHYDELRAEWDYPKSKLQAEEVILVEHGDIPVVIHRIAGVYDEKCHSLPVSQQIARIYEKQLESYVFPGDASHGQAVIHLDDLAECFKQTIIHRKDLAEDELFLISEPDAMSYGELQEKLGELIHGKEWPTIRIPKVVAKAGAFFKNKMAGEDEAMFIKPWMIDLADDHYVACIAHARQKLNWAPQHRFRDTLPQIVEFLKSNPEDFYKENKLPVPDTIKSE